ncbi:RNA-directed DNA polymerase from mobile element jockey [Trichonephila clavipes]|uniref:RNA-directed DNA polymerase from mobile element jockey n=1 Tax=Trichonephila clavipes TaxID=2585209 RepID=A0A8X6RQ09_TRICX|nr:RNA-directed DNA polymerase from mobile element jockey [Trichonephila clavipes]
MTGEYFKLYCDTHDQYHELLTFLENKEYEFYSIKLKAERPIKVVIKGLPKKAKTEDIHNDLINLAFTVDRVSQLTVRPNVSFAQAAQQERTKITAPTPQQMAPRNGQVPATIPTQTQAAITLIPRQPQKTNAKNECIGLSTQTLSQTIQALSLLVQQINGIDFTANTPQPSNAKKNIETLIQANNNCVIFGDFNATHNSWNCSKNSPRGIRLKDFADNNNLEIAFANSPTRYGYNTSSTLDFALISNFNYPYNIVSIPDLSSDHNPVILNFTITSPIHKDNPRAITTCWSAFRNNLKKEIRLFDFAKINNASSLEEKVVKFADAVSSAHNSASKPIKNNRHNYTPQHINNLITCKNRARKLFQQTLNPLHKTEANRHTSKIN